MNKYLLTFLLVMLSIGLCFGKSPSPSYPQLLNNGSALGSSNPLPVGLASDTINKITNVGFATPTVAVTATLDDVTAQDVADYLPDNITGFEIRAKTGGFIITHGDMIATGTNRVGRLVAEGESYIWRGNRGVFIGKFIANDTSSVVVFDGFW